MPVTTFSPLLGLALPTTGDLSGTWGTTVNDAITSLIDSSIAGTVTLSANADVTLSTTNGAANQARTAVILWTASNGATTRNVTAPAQSKAYIVINTGTGSVVIRGAGPTTGVTIASGTRALVAWNGTDFVKIVSNPVILTTDVSGTLPVANGGTSLTTLTANNVILGNGASAPSFVAPSTSGNVLTSNGTTWASSTPATGASGANPTATSTGTAINGSASTFMRSDAAFAISTATSTVSGLVPTPPNNTTTFLRGDATFATPSVAASTVIRSARTANTILGVADQGTLIDITSGTFSQTFTAAATLASGWFCYIRNSGTGDITLDPNAAELIDGLASYVMYGGETRLVQCTGSAFTSVVLSPFYRTFTATGTYTHPPGYTAVGTRVMGAAGGGGSGRRGAAANPRGGGTGGGGGALATQIISGLTAGTGYTATIGAGGAGGAAITADTTNGNVGTVGGTSSFSTLLSSYGGGGGGGGTDGTNQSGTGGGTGAAGQSAGQNGGNPQQTADMTSANAALNSVGGGGAGCVGNGSAGCAEYGGGCGGKNNAGTTIRAGGSSIHGGPGGGSGGTLSNADTVTAGGNGGTFNSYTAGGGAAGGAATGANGTAGAAGLNGYCGTGGGGGGSGTGVGGTGGAGGAPAASGGGGAASVNANNSGAGGVGGRGEVQVWGIA